MHEGAQNVGDAALSLSQGARTSFFSFSPSIFPSARSFPCAFPLQASDEARRVVQQQIPRLVRTLMESDEHSEQLLHVLQKAPSGSEGLLLQIIHVLTSQYT